MNKKWSGSGWGGRRRGRQVDIVTLGIGDILLNQNRQFSARNVAVVTGLGIGLRSFSARFVDPKDVTRLRDGASAGGFFVWYYEVPGQWFHQRGATVAWPKEKL